MRDSTLPSEQDQTTKQMVTTQVRLPRRTDVRRESPLAAEARPEPHMEIGLDWHAVLRRRWTIINLVIISVVIATIVSLRLTPVYQATAYVEVESETPQIAGLNDIYQSLPSGEEYLRTQAKILQTDSLAWRTIEQLQLSRTPEYTRIIEKERGRPGPDRTKMAMVRRFQQPLTVSVVPISRMLQVSYDSPDPTQAADIVNALVHNYVEYNFQQQYDATRQASGRMEQQLDELKARVEASQRALVDYQRQHSIVDVNDKQSVVEQRLGELSSQLTAAQSDRIQKESLYNQVRTNPEKVASLAQNELLGKLEERLAELKRQYTEAVTQYGPAFPKVLVINKQVQDYQSQITAERNRAVERVRADYGAAASRERLLAAAVESQKRDLGEFNRLLVEQNLLKGEFESNQQLYQRLLQHLKDATVSAGLKSSGIRIVDTALVPADPIRPNKKLNISVAALLGLILGVVVAWIQESVDHSVKTLDEIENLVGLPGLGVIPRKTRLSRPTLLRSAPASGVAITVLSDPRSVVAESFRSLRTSMLLSITPSPQVILVTSARASEGKTTTAVNLAISLAQQQQQGRVALIDCDLRRPSVVRSLNIKEKIGISSVLAGEVTLEECFRTVEGISNLTVIGSGPIPPNPAELLASSAVPQVLTLLRQSFDYIIIDSPPVLAVTDGTILSTMVDGVVIVVESGVTPQKAVARSVSVLQGAGARVLGFVLNKLDLHSGNYYGYGYGNGSYYYSNRS